MGLYDSRILLVDDEPALLQTVRSLLVNEGFSSVDTAENAAEADKIYTSGMCRLVLLDVTMPETDGFTLYERWRKRGGDIPVIFLSARDEDRARLRGLGLGADDYITKPFLPEELILRVKSVLRRVYRFNDGTVRIGESTVDFASGTVTKEGTETELTAKEFLLLSKLYERENKIVSVNALMDELWPDGSYGYENSLMVHIRRLREKIETDPSSPKNILTVRGLGYKLKR